MDTILPSLFVWFQGAYVLAFLLTGALTIVGVLFQHSWQCANRWLVLWILLLGYSYAIVCLYYMVYFQFNVIICNSVMLPVVLDAVTFVFSVSLVDRITVVMTGQQHGLFHRLRQSRLQRMLFGLGFMLCLLLSFLEHYLDTYETAYSGSFYTIFCAENWLFSAGRHTVEYLLVYSPLVKTFLQYSQQKFKRDHRQLNWSSQLILPDMKLHGCQATEGLCPCSQLRKPFTLIYQAACIIVFLVRPLTMAICFLASLPYRDLLLGMCLCTVEAYLCFELILIRTGGWKQLGLQAVQEDLSEDTPCLRDEHEDT